jgi:hypothetical protein
MSVVKAGMVAALAVAVGACGCGGVAGIGGSGGKTACAVFDASKSTRFVVPQYLKRLEAEAADVAEDAGSVVALVVTGDPRVEAIPIKAEFADLTGTEKETDRGEAVRRLVGEVDDDVRESSLGRENPAEGSGIVGGIDLLGDGGDCDSVLVLSDGLETEAFATQHAGVADRASRQRILRRLEARGLVPDLPGVALAFPFGGVLPQGTGEELTEEVLAGLRAFWAEYARAAAANLSWRADE